MDMEITNFSENGNAQKIVFDLGPTGLVTVPVGSGCSDLFQITPKHFVDEPHLRNFVVSSTEVFVMAQKEFTTSHPAPVPQATVAALSQMYRGLILELVKNLQMSGDITSATLYTNLDFVWQFCEIMFISSHPDLPVLPYLNDWVQVNFDQSSSVLSEILNELPDLELSSVEKIWRIIFTHTFHGKTQEVAKLLPYLQSSHLGHDHVFEEQLALMTELMRKKPVFHPNVDSITDFEVNWINWREECENRLSQRAFYGNDKLTFICKVLCGDEEGFAEAREKEYIGTWYQYLVMLLNYKYPTIKPSALKGFARTTIEDLGIAHELSSRDRMLFYAMEFDIVNVLKEIQTHWEHSWFALHFSDLVYSGGKFSNVTDVRIDYSSVSPIRNHFLLEYGTVLMEHPTLWQVGVRYLEAIPDNLGKAVIKECLQRKKPTTELDAQKLIQVAEKFSFGGEIHGICKKMALGKLRLKQLQNALLWAIKAGDGPLTTYIVDTILFDGDCQIEPSLLESLRNTIPCADRLMFLSGFCDFRKLMDRKDFKGATAQLCQLIRDDLIPKRIAHKILLNIHHLAENNVKFEASETSVLMEFLHSKVGAESMTDGEFSKLNTILMCNRAHEILSMFKAVQKNLAD